MPKGVFVLMTAGLLWGFGASPVLAHAFLKRAVPPVGGTVSTPPSNVVLSFTEALEPAFSTIEVRDAAGARVDTGGAGLVDGDRTRFGVGLKTLAPGTYDVTWHAVSVDTHRTEGHFMFTVAP